MTDRGQGPDARAGVEPTSVGEWWQFRGDRRLTGRSVGLQGAIQRPTLAWKHFVGARETLLAARLDRGTSQMLSLPETDLDAERWDVLGRDWGIGAPWYDLDGDGSACAIAPDVNCKVGKFLPSEPGLQKVEFESIFHKYGTSAGKGYPAYGRLYTRRDGEWQQVWRSASIPILFIANAIVGDFDHDGRLEIGVTPWYDLRVLDLETGNFKYKARFKPPHASSGRAYGWLGAYDLDRDGKDEFVILADFENHIEVLGWKNGRFRRRWHRLIERGITRKNTALRPGTNPVQDVTGDGNLEIVVSILNQHGDGLWHIIVFEGMTGKQIVDLPGQYLSGMYDVDGDGVAELFCTATPGPAIPPSAQLSILSLNGRRVHTLWQAENTSFQTHLIRDFPLNVNSGAATGRETVMAGPIGRDGQVAFATRRSIDPTSRSIEVTIWSASTDGTICERARLVGPHLEAVAVRAAAKGEPVALIRAQVQGDGGGEISCDGAALTPLCSRRSASAPTSVVVGRLSPQAKPTVIAQSTSETLLAFRPARDGQSPEPAWMAAGRVQSPRAQDAVMEGGVVLADMFGDGCLEVVAATASPTDGCARLVAIAPDGIELWHHDFPRFPGPMPPWNVGGLTYFFAGRFTDPQRCDVLVSLRRTSMHSDESYMLDGRTGDVIWHRTEGPCGLGCGGGWTAVYDYDGDGLDDAFSFYPHVAWAMHGPTGKLLLGEMARTIFRCDAFYAKPVVVRPDGDRSYILFAGTAYVLGLLDHDMNVAWQSPPADGTPAIMQAIGDIDGDGRLELLAPGYRREPGSIAQDFCCHDLATGQLRWRLGLPGSCFVGNNMGFPDSPTAPAVADLDGDGRDECVFAIDDTLYAVGTDAGGAAGEVCWTLKLPARLGPPAIADVEGSGKLQVIVACADGFVYGIGPAAKGPNG